MFHIDPIVRGYNLAMVALNFHIAYELYANTIGHYNWICEPVDTTVNQQSMRIATAIYMFWLSKLIELLDSVFFILRGKYNQGKYPSIVFLISYIHKLRSFPCRSAIPGSGSMHVYKIRQIDAPASYLKQG